MFQQKPLPAVKLTDINTIKSVFILVSDDASFYTPAFSLYNSFLHIIACTICHLEIQLRREKELRNQALREEKEASGSEDTILKIVIAIPKHYNRQQ